MSYEVTKFFYSGNDRTHIEKIIESHYPGTGAELIFVSNAIEYKYYCKISDHVKTILQLLDCSDFAHLSISQDM